MRKLNIALWSVQVFVGLFIALASGVPKFFLPPESLNMPIPLAQPFLYFIGAMEILGGLGLILPGLTRMQPRLTVLAASGLVLLTICAAVYQLIARQPESAVFALAVGAL